MLHANLWLHNKAAHCCSVVSAMVSTACLMLRGLLQILVSCTKGILNDTLETPQHILSRVLPPATTRNLAYLSGPSFAAEVAAGQPTVVTIASANDQAAGRAQMLLSNSRFRCYRTNDVEGEHKGHMESSVVERYPSCKLLLCKLS